MLEDEILMIVLLVRNHANSRPKLLRYVMLKQLKQILATNATGSTSISFPPKTTP